MRGKKRRKKKQISYFELFSKCYLHWALNSNSHKAYFIFFFSALFLVRFFGFMNRFFSPFFLFSVIFSFWCWTTNAIAVLIRRWRQKKALRQRNAYGALTQIIDMLAKSPTHDKCSQTQFQSHTRSNIQSFHCNKSSSHEWRRHWI